MPLAGDTVHSQAQRCPCYVRGFTNLPFPHIPLEEKPQNSSYLQPQPIICQQSDFFFFSFFPQDTCHALSQRYWRTPRLQRASDTQPGLICPPVPVKEWGRATGATGGEDLRSDRDAGQREDRVSDQELPSSR